MNKTGYSLPARALRRGRKALAFAAMAMLLAACQTSNHRADPMTTGSTTPVPSLKAMAAARNAWERNPRDIRLGLAYANQLKALEQTGQQLAVLKRLTGYHPKDMSLRAHYGRSLLKAGRPIQAENAFRAMIRDGQGDWKTYNALGAALAEQGRYGEAREQYGLSLKQSPNNPEIINNIAMSFILEGNPARAETLLRQAMRFSRGRHAQRLRQNLALAVGLQGRFKEARYIASQDLSPAEVAANMAYLKRMLGSANTWDKLKNG